MANESTTSTLDDITNASLVGPHLVAALGERPGLYMLAKEFDLTGQWAAPALKIPTETAWWGSANDDGAGVDTEFDATQGTDLSNTQVSTGGITVTPGEYGVVIELTDNVQEDSVSAIDLFGWLSGRMLHVIGLAITDDFCGLFASLSNSVGTSGADLTIAQLISAKQGVRTRTGGNYDAIVNVLDNQQVTDLESAVIATSTSMAVYAMSADRLIGYSPISDNSPNRQVAMFNGAPVLSTGLTDTANAGADVVGACFCPSTAYNDASGATTFAFAWKRMPRLETDRIVIGRSNVLCMTARAASAEMQDGSGGGVVTDA